MKIHKTDKQYRIKIFLFDYFPTIYQLQSIWITFSRAMCQLTVLQESPLWQQTSITMSWCGTMHKVYWIGILSLIDIGCKWFSLFSHIKEIFNPDSFFHVLCSCYIVTFCQRHQRGRSYRPGWNFLGKIIFTFCSKGTWKARAH